MTGWQFFHRIRVVALLIVLAVIGFKAWTLSQARERRVDWLQPISVAVVLVSEKPIPRATYAAWKDGLPSLEVWFTRQMARYQPTKLVPFSLVLATPVLSAPPPFQAVSEEVTDRVGHAWALFKARRSIDSTAGVSSDADLCIYVVLRDDGSLANGFVDGVAEAGGEFGMIRAPLSETELGLPLTAVAHELLHLVGASDKYDEQGHAIVPEGLGDSAQEKLYPQRFAEVMAGEVAESASAGRAPVSLREVTVGKFTAREIRW